MRNKSTIIYKNKYVVVDNGGVDITRTIYKANASDKVLNDYAKKTLSHFDNCICLLGTLSNREFGEHREEFVSAFQVHYEDLKFMFEELLSTRETIREIEDQRDYYGEACAYFINSLAQANVDIDKVMNDIFENDNHKIEK